MFSKETLRQKLNAKITRFAEGQLAQNSSSRKIIVGTDIIATKYETHFSLKNTLSRRGITASADGHQVSISKRLKTISEDPGRLRMLYWSLKVGHWEKQAKRGEKLHSNLTALVDDELKKREKPLSQIQEKVTISVPRSHTLSGIDVSAIDLTENKTKDYWLIQGRTYHDRKLRAVTKTSGEKNVGFYSHGFRDKDTAG